MPVPLGLIISGASLLQQLFVHGKQDYPELKDQSGNPMPLHYMQHARADALDLTRIWKDGHTICDDETGIPIARWSYSAQAVQPVTGFTIQGLPVYEAVSPEHPVWSTPRGVPEHLGTPGSEGTTHAKHGPLRLGMKPVKYRRGERLIAYIGMYGPIEGGGMTAPEPEPRGAMAPGKSAAALPGLLVAGGAVAAISGAVVPGLAAVGLGVLLGKAGSAGMGSGASGGRGALPEESEGLE